MMILRWTCRGLGLLLAALLCARPTAAFRWRNVSDFPRPSATTSAVCGPGYGMFICDPDRLLMNTNRRNFQRLLLEMRRLRDGTPCFCTGCSHLTGSHRTLVLGLAVAERIYIPPNVTNRKFYLRQVAHALRLHWALGECPGSENDALILYDHASDEIVYSFGYLVSARLGRRCVQRIENYPNLLAYESRLMMAVHVLRNAARNPCCGNSCLYLNINWYKMLAWVCGGLVLLSALTFVGRRMWSRNLYIRTARPRTSLSSGRFSAVRPRCRNSRSNSRPRSTGSFPDADLQLGGGGGGGGAHVLYSTQAPPPYPGTYPAAGVVQQAPPYAGKPPAYSELDFGQEVSPSGEERPAIPPEAQQVPPPPQTQQQQQQQQQQPQQQQPSEQNV